MQRVLLRGLRSARLVFHNSRFVRQEIERWGLVPPSRLVHAPLGIAPEFSARPTNDPEADAMFVWFGPEGVKSAETEEVAPGIMLDFANAATQLLAR